MSIFTNNLALDLLGILTALTVVTIAFIKYKYTFYSRKGLYTPKPVLLFGNAKKVFTKQQHFGEFLAEIYNDLKKKNLKHGGAYFITNPLYVPADLNIVKSILQNDFHHFMDHGMYTNEKGDPLNAHVFNLNGDKWKNMRMKLTPTFSSGKIKMMFETLAKCAEGLKEVLDETVDTKEAVDIKDILQRFTIDIIGSCAFGLDCNSLKNPDSKFAKYGKDIFDFDTVQMIKSCLQFAVSHDILRKCNMCLHKSHITKFFIDLTKRTVEYREKNNIYRNDFLQLLIQLKNKDDGEGLTLKELSAQVFVFFIAGFETSSTTMMFALFELCKRPDLLKKVREEIVEVLGKHNNKLTYDAVKDMKYMGQVIDETLRMHPPFPFLPRICNKNYKIPDTNVVIKEGETVQIPILGIQHDPEIYPDPKNFDPDRFSEENKAERHQFAWLPFGAGPRACFGIRFGITQIKVGLTTILNNYNISLNDKTVQPIKYEPSGLVLTISDGLWIDVTKKVD